MTPIKVYMWPPPSLMKGGLTSGMAAVVNAYYQYLPAHGIQFVDANHADIIACHVEQGKAPRVDVLHNHGLIWAGDAQNARIAAAARGVKMLLAHTPYKIDTLVSLGIEVVILAISVVASLLRPKRPVHFAGPSGPEVLGRR